MSNLDEVLRQFEAAEANLSKLEKVWNILEKNIPKGIAFEDKPVYENACRHYKHILAGLPSIDDWRPTTLPCGLDEIAQSRLDSEEGEFSSKREVNSRIEKIGKELQEYRCRFDQKRRELVRDIILQQKSNEIQRLLTQLQEIYPIDEAQIEYGGQKIDNPMWWELREQVRQIDVLLGSSIPRPSRWSDMQRHLYYALSIDLKDIVCSDWPSVKEELKKSLYTSNEPIPVSVNDLSDLVTSKPSGSVITKLRWENLSAEDFERLVFNLVAGDENHENPEWSMRTNAADRGRDLSVYRVYKDKLSGVTRKRVIIQCKHWLSKSVAVVDIAEAKEKVKLWESPRIDILVIATTGGFTADAVSLIERHNVSDSAMTIEKWAKSDIERILASNPALVAEFGLR
ncbi:MAG: restriction endonuclease [Hormoscilla sp. GM7CHS1pb]|nr:restriction endonuclease [Hormoscilla sp. GM7CHS1pb]